MPIYMNYDSLAVKGDVNEPGHKEWVELNSLKWGLGRGIRSPVGRSADRESSAPSISEVTVTKASDISTIKIMNEALQGKGKTVIIDFGKTSADTMEVFMTYTLTNCMISGYSVNGSGDRPSETLTLNFTKFECKNIPNTADGSAGSPESITYDIAQAKVV